MRDLNYRCVTALMFVVCGVAAPLRAQTDVERTSVASAAASTNRPAVNASVDSPLILPALRSTEGSLPSLDWPRDDSEPAEGSKDERQAIQPPAGPPPTPRHTGIKAMLKGLGTDVKHLPSRQNLLWVGIGGGLALAAHPF